MSAERFNSPSGLDALAHGGSAGGSDLARQSLYIKFDPLVSGSPTPTSRNAGAASVNATPQAAANTSDKLLDFATPEAQRRPGGSRGTADILSATPDRLTERLAQTAIGGADQRSSGTTFTNAEVEAMVAEAQVKAREEMSIAQMEIEDLRNQLKDANKAKLEMTQVVEEYGSAMKKMVEAQKSGSAADKLKTLEAERSQLEEDLRSTENAFSDLHRKYEKAKEIIDNFKANEEKLKATVAQAQEACAQGNERYEKLHAHAEEKIQLANQEIHNVREEHKQQLSGYAAKLKHNEMTISQLKRQLEAKEADNRELTQICDDLVRQAEGRM